MVSTIICDSSFFDNGSRFIYRCIYTGNYDAGCECFGEVKDAFSVFLYNWTRITELRSIHKRLMEFEKAIKYDSKKFRSPQKSDVRA